jgi:RNA polymerase sigma-70 factor (ECF subfamily)
MTSATETPLDDGLPPQAAAAHSVRVAIDQAADSVRAYLFGMTANWHDAEDLAQAAMLKAWQKREQFSAQADAKTWIFTIARNHWRDALRTRSRTPGHESMHDGHDIYFAAAANPVEQLQQQELAAALAAAMVALPDAQREALALRESDGLTFPQIASVLDLPVATVKSRVRYALAKLADELRSYREGASS